MYIYVYIYVSIYVHLQGNMDYVGVDDIPAHLTDINDRNQWFEENMIFWNRYVEYEDLVADQKVVCGGFCSFLRVLKCVAVDCSVFIHTHMLQCVAMKNCCQSDWFGRGARTQKQKCANTNAQTQTCTHTYTSSQCIPEVKYIFIV